MIDAKLAKTRGPALSVVFVLQCTHHGGSEYWGCNVARTGVWRGWAPEAKMIRTTVLGRLD